MSINLSSFLLFLIFLIPSQPTIKIINTLITPFDDNSIPYLYSNFGQINYDKSQSFDLLIMNTTLCTNHSFVLTTPTYIVIPADNQYNCTHTKQAMLAEWLGAKGILIGWQGTQEWGDQVILADDGNGRRVHIPSLFITDKTYSKLSQIDSTNIQITVNFPIKKAEITKLTFFLSSSQRSSYIFLKPLNEDFLALRGQVQIDVVYSTFKNDWTSKENCLLEEYCTYDHDSFRPKVGQIIIREQLHQYNVLTTLGASSWLKYMTIFDEVCSYNWLQIDKCVSQTSQKTGIKVGIAEPSTTLQMWRQKQKQFSFETIPQVAINGMIFSGSLQYQPFITAVCESLLNPPTFCTSPNQIEPSNKGKYQSEAHVIFVLILTIFLMSSLSFYFYRKCVKRQTTVEMTARVNELVANYASRISSRQGQRRAREQEELNQQL